MSQRLESKLARLRSEGRRGLSPFVTAGDGGLATTLEVLRALERSGASCVELGLPFSDPIADGPVLQAAAQRSLEAGTTFAGTLDMLAELRASGGEVPVVIMAYANTILRHGWVRACERIATAGGDGILIADLPVEEGAALAEAAAAAGLCPIFFVAPTTSEERMRRAAAMSRGFLYAIGRFGVTGAGADLDEKAQAFLARVRAAAGDLPVAVGFGIATPDHVRAATRHADLAIVGSALVDHVHRAQDPARAAYDFAKRLVEALEG